MAANYYLYCGETGHGVAVGEGVLRLSDQYWPTINEISLYCLAHINRYLQVRADQVDLVSSKDAKFFLETSSTVTYSLFCEETSEGIDVGKDSMSVPNDQCEPSSVISLFCLAHRDRSLQVLADPDMVGNWEAGVAAELFHEITGEQAPDAWNNLVIE